MGTIEPTAYRGIRRNVYESDTNFAAGGFLSKGTPRNPTNVHNSGTVRTGYANGAYGCIFPYLWLQRAEIKEEMRLFFPVSWTLEEIMFSIRYEMLLATAKDVTAVGYHVLIKALQLCEVVDGKKGTRHF
jgi:hypothetical protein